jgi:hypothetical protein
MESSSSSRGPYPPSRRRFLFVLALVLLSVCAAAPAAFGFSVQQEYAKFDQCPVDAPNLFYCVYAQTKSGEFVIGSKTVPITKTITIQGGLNAAGELIPAVNGETLSKTPLTLPGGLTGVQGLEIGGEVTATAELAGTAILNPTNILNSEGTAASLPLKIKLDNPVLGNSCYIGSNSNPVLLHLTTGTTNPPPPNKPISGSVGEVTIEPSVILHLDGNSLVDNAFAAPGVTGCVEPLSLVFDPAIDLVAGLPSAAGKNTAILTGTVDTTVFTSVVEERKLPEFGRCVKVKGERVGGLTVFHGGWEDPGCIEENPPHGGPYEWTEGAANSKFTALSSTTTLTTTGGSRVKCAASASSGEYTSPKTLVDNVKFTGCFNPATKQSCQSSGAAAGEIVASALEGHLGFIRDTWTKVEKVVTSVGLDLTGKAGLFSAECGTTPVSVGGSVIGVLGPIDKPAAKFTIKYSQESGKQIPEAFELGSKETLNATFGAGPQEQTGLTSADSVTNGEKLEIRAQYEQ